MSIYSHVFTIRNEIIDWFYELVYKSFGQISYFSKKSNKDGHFDIHSEIEISGDETQINEAIEFVRNIDKITRYKMPWVIGNPYYVLNDTRKELAIQELENLENSNYGTIYKSAPYNIIGTGVYLFNFPPDLDANEMIKIDKIFKYLAEPTSIFITNPKVKLQPSPQSDDIGTHILTALHEAFLPYLSLEDIMCLDMANHNGNSCWDDDLAHDIKELISNKLSMPFPEISPEYLNLRQFQFEGPRIHFIHKYCESIRYCSIPNIFTTQEIQSRSRLYYLSFDYNNIIHIDFKTVGKPKIVNFCAVFDCGTRGFITPNYANRNYFVRFGDDNEILDTTNTVHEFTRFFIKSRKDCSASKTNALLKYLTKTFKACQFDDFQSTLTLHEFDLNRVSDEVFSDLLSMIRHGNIIFEKISISLSSLVTILEQSVGNRIMFRRCRIIQDKIEEFTKYSRICFLSFCDMDIELNIIRILKNIVDLQFVNCHILQNNREDVLPVRHFRDVIDGAQNVHFICCDFPPCNIVEEKYFSVTNNLNFNSMAIKLEPGFQILEKCKTQNQIIYENCHFRFESDSNLLLDLKPAGIIFRKSTFDSLGLYTILRKLHQKSNVWLERSYITPQVEHFDNTSSNTMILVKELTVKDCTIDTATLLNYLGKISSSIVEIRIENCKLLLPPDFSFPNNSIHTKKLVFYYVKFTQRHLITILNCFNQNSIVKFRLCEIIDSDCELNNFNFKHEIIIRFSYMTIDLNTPLFQQKKWKVYLDNCDLINTNVYGHKKLKSSVTFRDMRFYTDAQFELFQNFTGTSEITIIRCSFDYMDAYNLRHILIKPRLIEFENIALDIKMLHVFMERIAADTIVIFNKCDFEIVASTSSERPIQVRSTYFLNMQIDVKTVLWVLKNFTKNVEFKNCKISSSDLDEILDPRLLLNKLILKNMDLTVDLLSTFIRFCSSKVLIVIEKCNFIFLPQFLALKLPRRMRRLLFIDVDYSPGLLQSLKDLHNNCYVEFKGKLSAKNVIEICTTTQIYEQFKLSSKFHTKTFYFELFTTYVESLLPSFRLYSEIIYDVPSFIYPLLPHIVHGKRFRHSLSELQIRVSSINDVKVKVDFLRGGKTIDLFYLLNDSPDDTERPCDYRTD